MELVGIEISNFRSIGEELVVIYPMKKCNILIGKNNVGKSNVIRAFQWISEYFANTNRNRRLEGFDRHRKTEDPLFKICLRFRGSEEDVVVQASNQTEFFVTFSEIKEHKGLHAVDHSFAHIDSPQALIKVAEQLGEGRALQGMFNQKMKEWFKGKGIMVFQRFFSTTIPQIQVIPQFRQIQQGDTYEFNGANLIRELEKYHRPPIGEEHLLERFAKIQKLLQELLHLPDARLDVPQGGTQIAITNDGLRLPLEDFGTGVHELIILATAILSIEQPNTICCIEEPEIHLHPALQREFIEFITTQTNIRYLISTHSPTLINAQNDVQVFHLRLENGATVGGPVLEDEHALLALNDIGVKASDILQANCVIWVEGPSDRIYLKRWIELLDNELIEGLHYSIMFYGGRLLSHLNVSRSSDGKVPDELIDLLRVNQHAAVVMDSDREQAGKRINGTKTRIRKQCEQSESHCWITDGREIENYLPARVVKQAIGAEFQPDPYKKFEANLADAIEKAKVSQIDYANNKVKYAREFAEHFTVDDIDGDLESQLKTLIAKIKKWNE